MSVPNTANFSLQDVVNEIGSGSSLINCFANAVAAGFDPLYGSISSTQLYAFRNYNHAAITVDPVSLGYSAISSVNACGAGLTTYYIDDGLTWLTSTYLWDDNIGTVPSASGFYSDGTWYREWNGSVFLTFKLAC